MVGNNINSSDEANADSPAHLCYMGIFKSITLLAVFAFTPPHHSKLLLLIQLGNPFLSFY